MHMAARGGNIEYARVLLENGASASYRAKYGDQPIHDMGSNRHSTKETYIAFYRLLIQNGADINSKGEHGRTPLVINVASRSIPRVEALLELGANKGFADTSGMTACQYADGNSELEGLLDC